MHEYPVAGKGVSGPPFPPTNFISFWPNLVSFLVPIDFWHYYFVITMRFMRFETNFGENRNFDVIMTSNDVSNDVATT